MRHCDSGTQIQVININDDLVGEINLYNGRDDLEFIIRNVTDKSSDAHAIIHSL